MDILGELEKAAQDARRLFAIMDRADVMASSSAPLLQSMRTELEQQLAEALRLTPAALAELEQKRETSAARLEKAQAHVTEAQQSIAAFGTIPPVPPLADLTVEEGQGLAAQLLARHGIPEDASVKPRTGGDVASLVSMDFQPAPETPRPTKPSPPPAPPLRPPARPSPGLGSITESDLSSEE